MTISRPRLEYAAEGFIASMRRSWISRHGDKPCPVKRSLSEYPSEDRGALIKAIEIAIKMTEPAADGGFTNWQETKKQNAQ